MELCDKYLSPRSLTQVWSNSCSFRGW